jgi:hypothetical protein
MRTLNLYYFSELSEEAKKRAILDYKEEMEENEQQEAFRWAIDDCALFEPAHDELVAVVGDDYYDRNGGFIMENGRKGIEISDYSCINIKDALTITNSTMFLKWLGVPDMFIDNVEYEISDTTTTTEIEMTHNRLMGDPLADALTGILTQAESKFANHINVIKHRIDSGIEEYFSDDNIIDRLAEDEEVEFTEDGILWNS